MPEILNLDEVAMIVKDTKVTNDHSLLLSALKDRYPGTPFRLLRINEGRSWNAGIIDSAGNRISDDLAKWVDQEIELAGGDARAVWEKHKNSGFIRSERIGGVLYLTAPYGVDPDAFWQLEIECGAEMTVQYIFNPRDTFPPEDRFDIVSGSCLVLGDDQRQELSPPAYNFEALTNIRRFLRELVETEKSNRLAELPDLEKRVIRVQDIVLGPEGGQTSQDVAFLDLNPDYLDRMPPAYRLFQDWAESSAGLEGHRFCDHWWCQTNRWTGYDGRSRLSLIPQWADADGGLDLPEIWPDWEASPYGVMEQLQQFDQQVGYPFAWYFYMLHGNRISHPVGRIVAEAIQKGVMKPLPEWDEQVLLRWKNDNYGF